MRRVAVVLVALLLVNLPFVHRSLAERELSREGRDIEATVVDIFTINGRRLVDYRLPASVDESRGQYTARVDEETYDLARETDVIAVRVLPDDPASNRPLGGVRSPLFLAVALTTDAVVLVLGLLLLRRWRRRSRHEVVIVEGADVTLASSGRTLTASAPQRWTERVRAGDRVSGALRVVADTDVLPTDRPSGWEQVRGSSYVVRGRVLDARAGRVVLDLGDGFRLTVETRDHRIRADIRDTGEVRGRLVLTPSVARG